MKLPLVFARPLLAAALLLVLLTAAGCRKDADVATGSVSFTVQHVAGGQPLVLGGPAYATPAGETLTISTFRYYLSNFQFTRADGSVYAAPQTYFLVDQDRAASLTFTVPGVPAGDYVGFSCLIGVDANTTGLTDPVAFTGPLDALNPANNMYWSWNTGHIFLKLEGQVTSTTPARSLVAHIGGYQAPNSAIVRATPTLPAGARLAVSVGRASTVRLQADALKCFDGVTRIPLSTFSPSMMPGPQSVAVARNYGAGMLSVVQVQN